MKSIILEILTGSFIEYALDHANLAPDLILITIILLIQSLMRKNKS